MQRFALAVFLIAAAAAPAEAAPHCGSRALAEFTGIERQLRKLGSGCDQAINRRNIDIDAVCRKCRPTILTLARFDRAYRKHPGCFSDRAGKRFRREWAQFRSAIRFFRRGCGY